MIRSYTLSLLATVAIMVPQVHGQALVYQWLNQPCSQNLNCDAGCSACNMPGEMSDALFGSSAVWSGITVCPHPISEADNAVYTSGWPISADPMVFVGVNAVSQEAIQIDSIVIRHRRSADGPQRLRVTYSPDMANVPVLLGETEVTQEFEETIYTDLGCLTQFETSPYTGLQLRFQGIQGGAGDLQIDEVRIVSSPCETPAVSIPEHLLRFGQQSNGYIVDVLGRAIVDRPAPGVYIGDRKRVHVVQ